MLIIIDDRIIEAMYFSKSELDEAMLNKLIFAATFRNFGISNEHFYITSAISLTIYLGKIDFFKDATAYFFLRINNFLSIP